MSGYRCCEHCAQATHHEPWGDGHDEPMCIQPMPRRRLAQDADATYHDATYHTAAGRVMKAPGYRPEWKP